MISYEKPPDPPFAADAGIASTLPRPQDAFRALDELMVVIEALCPRWPGRQPFDGSATMVL